MARTRAAAALLALLTSVFVGVPPSVADTVDVPYSTTAFPSGEATLTIDVPAGVRPEAVTGRLAIDRPMKGRVVVSVRGRAALSVAAQPVQWVRVPVGPADVVGGRILLRMDLQPDPVPGTRCIESDASATLDHVRLVFSGREQPPTTVARFLPPYSPRVDVTVPRDPTDGEIAAGLAAVAAVSSRYPSTTTLVVLRAATEPPVPAETGYRVIRVRESGGEARTAITTEDGVPTLTVQGDAPSLLAAVRALASRGLSLANGDRTEGLFESSRGSNDPVLTRTLAELSGADRLVLSGYGHVESYVGVKQDAFGSPIGTLDLHLVGTHSAVPRDARAQLDVYVNNALVHSMRLEGGTDIDQVITIPGTRLEGVNGLVLALSAVPDRRSCIGVDRPLPLEVDIDARASTVTATPGESVAGLARFPQVLGGVLPVAIADGANPLGSAIDAAYVVSALQRQAARPLAVSLVDPDELLVGSASGLLVGADGSDSSTIQAPLRLDEMRLIDSAKESFQVGTDQAFAALEAVRTQGRDVLLMGSWSPVGGAPGLSRRLARAVEVSGWSGLTGDLFVATGDTKPFTLDSNAVVPQKERVEEQQSFILWLVAGAGVLVLVLVLRQVVIARRRRQIATIVDAKTAAHPPGGR
ncbi:MAG TPA: cellulose biosynthesis cyclic di-GMP-binding regulatory protein BcsB [Nocardioides sp.]|nr:cellulose biosynthesis cyclic di-GMP-binding regulatory protein BcsB [Nocardioides sp.]